MDYISFQQQHHLILLYVAIFLLLIANLAPKSSIVFFKNNQRKDSIQVALWQPVITDNKPCSTVINGAAFTLPCSEIETDEVVHEVPFHFAACLISMDDNKVSTTYSDWSIIVGVNDFITGGGYSLYKTF